MNKIVLCSKEPVCVILPNSKFDLLKNSKKVIETSDSNLCFDYYYLYSPSTIFHSNIVLLGESKMECSENLSLTIIDDTTVLTTILRKNAEFLQKKCKKITKNNLTFNFYQNGCVEIESNDELKFSQNFDIQIVDADVLALKNNFYCIKLFDKNNTSQATIINDNFESVLNFNTAIVESSDLGFKALTDLNDVSCHGLVESFSIESELKKVDEYSVYLKNKPINNFNIHILPIYFLQCIRAKDFKEAKNCLSENLKSTVQKEHLSKYFGNFCDVFNFVGNYYIKLPTVKNNVFVAKQCVFDLQNGKIANIELKN